MKLDALSVHTATFSKFSTRKKISMDFFFGTPYQPKRVFQKKVFVETFTTIYKYGRVPMQFPPVNFWYIGARAEWTVKKNKRRHFFFFFQTFFLAWSGWVLLPFEPVYCTVAKSSIVLGTKRNQENKNYGLRHLKTWLLCASTGPKKFSWFCLTVFLTYWYTYTYIQHMKHQ